MVANNVLIDATPEFLALILDAAQKVESHIKVIGFWLVWPLVSTIIKLESEPSRDPAEFNQIGYLPRRSASGPRAETHDGITKDLDNTPAIKGPINKLTFRKCFLHELKPLHRKFNLLKKHTGDVAAGSGQARYVTELSLKTYDLILNVAKPRVRP